MVRDRSSNNKIKYVTGIKNVLNPKGHQNPISGSKGTAILLKGWIGPIGGVASGRVGACSLQSRLVCGAFCLNNGFPFVFSKCDLTGVGSLF